MDQIYSLTYRGGKFICKSICYCISTPTVSASCLASIPAFSPASPIFQENLIAFMSNLM